MQACVAVTDIAVPALIIHLQEIHEWNVFLLIDSLAHLINHLWARLANDDRCAFYDRLAEKLCEAFVEPRRHFIPKECVCKLMEPFVLNHMLHALLGKSFHPKCQARPAWTHKEHSARTSAIDPVLCAQRVEVILLLGKDQNIRILGRALAKA